MSVGHVARVFEEAGLPTASIYVRAFRHVVDEMKLPRAVITPHPMGRPLGPPGDRARHREVLRAALALLDGVGTGARLVEMGGGYSPGPAVGPPSGG